MAVSAGMIAKAAATVLSNEKLRKGVGWALVAILSPVIVLIALLCSIGSGGADHNNQAVAASFYGVNYSTEVPAEFRYQNVCRRSSHHLGGIQCADRCTHGEHRKDSETQAPEMQM